MGMNKPLRSRSYSQFLLQLVVIWLLVCSHYNYHYGAQAKLTQAVLQKLLSPDNASIDLHDFTKLATKGISGEELEFLVNNQAQKIWAMTKDPTVISKAKEILDYSRLSVVYLSKIVPAKVVFLVGAALVTSMECAVVLNQVQHIDSFLRHNRNELAAIQAVIEEVEKVHIHPMKEMLKDLNMRMGAIELLTVGKEFNQHAASAKSTLRDVERRLRTQAELLHKEKTEAQTSKKRFSKMSTGALVSTVAGGLAVFAGMASPYLAVLGKAFLYGGVSTGIFSSVMRTSSDLLQGKTEFMLDENGKLMDKTIKDIREVDALQADFSNLHSKIYLHHDDYKSAKEMNMVLLISCVSWVSLCLFLFCRKKIQQTAVTLKNHIFRNTATAHVARPRDTRANIRQVLSWVAALLATLVLALVVLDFGYKYHVSVHNSAAQEQNRDDFRKIFAKEKYEEYCRFVFIPAHRQLLMQYLPFIFGDATTNTEGYLMNDYCTNLRLSLSETSNVNYIKKIGHIQGSYIHAFFREVAVLITDVLEMIGSNTSFDTKIWVAVFLMPSALFAFLGYFLTFVTCTVPAILKKALFGL